MKRSVKQGQVMAKKRASKSATQDDFTNAYSLPGIVPAMLSALRGLSVDEVRGFIAATEIGRAHV